MHTVCPPVNNVEKCKVEVLSRSDLEEDERKCFFCGRELEIRRVLWTPPPNNDVADEECFRAVKPAVNRLDEAILELFPYANPADPDLHDRVFWQAKGTCELLAGPIRSCRIFKKKRIRRLISLVLQRWA